MAEVSRHEERDMSYKWTDVDVDRLIRLRIKNAGLFSGRRFAAAAGWEAVVKEMGLSRLVSPARAAKKWENLKKAYKELRQPQTGVGSEGGEPTAATWKWYSLMDEAIGSRPSVQPPCLIASAMGEGPSTSVDHPPAPVEQEADEEEEEGSSMAAKRPRRESLVSFLEKAEKKEEEREKREEERAKRDEEREERLLKLLERVVDKL